MHRHLDRETGEVCAVTITTSEWRRLCRRRRGAPRRSATYLVPVQCDVRGVVKVPATVVADQSIDAKKGGRA